VSRPFLQPLDHVRWHAQRRFLGVTMCTSDAVDIVYSRPFVRTTLFAATYSTCLA
jgi:hypothetical protein